MIKKTISLLLAFIMIFSIMTPTNVFGVNSEGNTIANSPARILSEASIYSDTTNHWARTEIEKWSNLGIIQGSDGLFRPASPITRGEFAVIIDRLMKYQVKAANSFNDLSTTWYSDAILGANYAGIILGSNGQVRPNDLITREEAVVMLGRALEIPEGDKSAGFSDMTSISPWAEGYINGLSTEKIINGIGNNLFAPKSNVTRGEVVKILDNAVKGLYNNAGTYSADADGNVIISSPNVTLKNMEITGNLIIAEGVGEGEVNIDNVKIKGNTIVKGGGENSVYFNNVTVEGALIVNKVGGNLRIVATGTTSVSVATLESGAIIITKDLVGGGIEKVVIPASIAAGQNIVLQGNFKTVENNAEDIKIEANGKIDKLMLNEKSTITGKVEVAFMTTANGADSVINGKTILGGQKDISVPMESNNNTSGSRPNSGGGDNSGDNEPVPVTGVTLNKSAMTLTVGSKEVLIATISPSIATTKTAIWSSNNTDVATVTNGEVNAVSTGSAIITITTVDGNKSAECEVTVTEAPEPGWQPPVEIDSRFALGYPSASVNEENIIDLKVKLTSPGEIFMIVNQWNSHIDPSVESVIHGHTGEDETIMVDEAPYINITDTNEHIINTNVSVSGSEDIKIYFVIRDENKTSETPTLVEFTGEAVTELDNQPPNLDAAFINSAKDKIMLYFDELLNESSNFSASEFTLSTGNVTDVSVTNHDFEYRQVGKVILTVNGITDTTNLNLSYMGTSIKDKATLPNEVVEIIEEPVSVATMSIPSENVFVSNNGQYIKINTVNSVFFEPNNDKFELSLKYGDKNLTEDVDYDMTYSYAHDGSYIDVYIKLNEIPVLNGSKYIITFDPNGLKDFGGDTVTVINAEGTPNETKESDIVPSSAIYDENEQTLTIKFPEDNGLEGNVFGCFFKLSAGGKDYILRGNPWFDDENQSIMIESESFPFNASTFGWSDATISYSTDIHENIYSDDCLIFSSGYPCQGFTGLEINIAE